MSNQRTLEQERASVAWKFIRDEVKKMPESIQKEYASLAKKATADIQTNGLGQTLAFWRAKGYENGKPKDNGKNAHYQIIQHLTKWFAEPKSLHLQTTDVVHWISESTTDITDYRRATTEAIAFLVWLKRFAESDLPS